MQHSARSLILVTLLLLSWGCQQENAGHEGAQSNRESIPPDFSSPQATLAHYLGSLKTGERAGVDRVMLDGEGFAVVKPLPLDSFRVTRNDTLDAAAAAERPFKPAPRVGDVELDVAQYWNGGGEQMYTYHFREVDGEWLLHSWSAWGVDVIEEEDR